MLYLMNRILFIFLSTLFLTGCDGYLKVKKEALGAGFNQSCAEAAISRVSTLKKVSYQKYAPENHPNLKEAKVMKINWSYDGQTIPLQLASEKCKDGSNRTVLQALYRVSPFAVKKSKKDFMKLSAELESKLEKTCRIKNLSALMKESQVYQECGK